MIRNLTPFKKSAQWLFAAILFISLGSTAKAQNFYKEKIPRENYLQFGVGPSFMYADNAGGLRRIDFNIRPALSASFGRSMTPHLDLRGTLGYQFYKSREMGYFNQQTIASWSSNNEAVESRSNILFLDVMPTFSLFKQSGHTYRQTVNLYAGVGLGLMMAANRETKFKNEALYDETPIRGIAYIPMRGGITYKIDLYSDIALEGSILAAFSDRVEGLTGYNRFNDMMFQGQIVYRRYLSKMKGVY